MSQGWHEDFEDETYPPELGRAAHERRQQMIHVNTDEDTQELREVHERLVEEAKKLGVQLDWVEVKGTVYFHPKLPAKDG